MDKQKEPRLRFKGFTGAWEYKKFENVLSIKSGMSQKEIEVSDGIYPILATSGEIGRTNTALYDKESVLIGRKGTIDKPYYMNTPFWTVDTLFYSELKNNIDGKFLYFLFQCIEWRKLDTSTGVPSLTSTTIHEIQRYFPSKPEQTHLGLFFRRLDSQIAESRAVLEKSRQLKKATLAKMFPANGEKIPKIRFKGFEGEWREWKLGAFGKATSGTSLESEFCEDGNYKVISIGSYSEKSTYTDQGIRTHKNDKTEKRILNKNDLTMILNDKTSSGRIIGRVLLIDQNDTYVYNQRTQRIEIDQEHFIPLFLYHLLNAENMRQKIIYSAQGNTQIYVNWSGIKNLEYLIPPTKAEQTAIGNFFRQLDETIALQLAEVEKLNQLKKGLLAAMLV